MAKRLNPKADELLVKMTSLKIIEKNTDKIPLPLVGESSNPILEMETDGIPSASLPDVDKKPDNVPTVLILMGMAGSGKTTLTSALISHLQKNGSAPYVVNLDPACMDPPYGVNIDIRDTIDYKQVMHGNRLGPNGAIVTSLNLFATKFDTVLNILKERGKDHRYIIMDTPGQIEVFMWSASGSIITELLASNFPTIMVYVTDLAGTKSPIAFMSNMTYACSVLYKTKLPLVLALNKCDIENAEKVKTWITDFDAFQSALNDFQGQSVNLASSLSLVLDDFYSNIQHVPVSALTGLGMKEFFESINVAEEEYKTIYRVNYEKAMKERKGKLAMPAAKAKASSSASSDSFAFSVSGTSALDSGMSLTLDPDSDGPESEEEEFQGLDEKADHIHVGEETIRQVYQKEVNRRLQKAGESSCAEPMPPS